MLQTNRRISGVALVLAILPLAALVFLAAPAWAKTGSYTISFGGTAPTGTQIRVTAKADGETYDETFDIENMTEEQARNLIFEDLESEGWTVTKNGTNGINIKGKGNKKIKQVDIGDNKAFVDTKGDGNVTIDEALPGDKKFKFACALPAAARAPPQRPSGSGSSRAKRRPRRSREQARDGAAGGRSRGLQGGWRDCAGLGNRDKRRATVLAAPDRLRAARRRGRPTSCSRTPRHGGR